ncbi:hypothetical protein POJ06DRAFT_5130 [Lipomyces tetrasporus]|uniref:Secreted protein n=1 Tax=Lipomyces tetrasporus TaxID=54092 RepID=A0AAD7QY67_9ASCO|nr:uncharacterized protein POJ06DRAFT_5130 [Lipomyces tetrasporus]KAJ8103610.1 hypothetical protein POJ06DRAFT_5130 [Lipomyces tetrasporus]
MKTTVAVVFTTVFIATLGASAFPTVHRNHSKRQALTSPNSEPYIPGKLFDLFFMIIGENMDLWPVESQSMLTSGRTPPTAVCLPTTMVSHTHRRSVY